MKLPIKILKSAKAKILKKYYSKDFCNSNKKLSSVISINIALNILEKIEERKQKKQDIIDIIIEIVENYYYLVGRSIQLKTRERGIVFSRQICHYFAKKLTNLSNAKIGEKIGNKDHSTVLHSNRVINNYLDTDKKIAKEIKEIGKLIKMEIL